MHDSTFKQILASFIITLSVLMSGTFFGWPSPVAQAVRSGTAPVTMTSAQLSWMVTCIEFGNLLLPLPAGYLMDAVGRRACLATSAPLALAGWALALFAQDVLYLYAARVLHGCAMGIAYTVAPVYLGEMAGAKIRGSLGLFHQGMNSSGILFVYAVGWTASYYVLASVMTVVPILLIVLLRFVPESPYYLAMKGDTKGALESLLWLRPSADLAELRDELRNMTPASPQPTAKDGELAPAAADGLLKTSARPLAIVLIMGVVQIFVGISALEAYASSAFKDQDASSAFKDQNALMTLTPNACAVMLGLVALSSDLVSASVIERFGRRPLLLASCVGCCASHAAAAYGLWRGDNKPLVLAALAGAMFCANAGVMPMVTIIVCEYFPTHNRAQANGVLQLVVTAASLVSLKIYQPVSEAYGTYANYALFAAVSTFSVAFVYRFIPETKGLTFMEIETLLAPKKKKPPPDGTGAGVINAAAVVETP